MATVIVNPQDSKLVMRFVTGVDPVTGAPRIKTKTFSRVKSAALDQNVYDVGTALVGLQKYTLDEMFIIKTWQITE